MIVSVYFKVPAIPARDAYMVPMTDGKDLYLKVTDKPEGYRLYVRRVRGGASLKATCKVLLPYLEGRRERRFKLVEVKHSLYRVEWLE